jgi:hypothetical protein
MRPAIVLPASIVAVACIAAPAVAQQATAPLPMIGGGDVTLRQGRDDLRVTVTGPRAGLASLCVGDESRVRILHASAAVGEATYERSGERWVLKSGFEFKLRDTPKSAPSEADRTQYLSSLGWVANASRAGDPIRTFLVRLSERVRFVGITFLTTGDPMAISHWPASMDDDCRAMKIAQGYLPDSAQFRPAGWHRIQP